MMGSRAHHTYCVRIRDGISGLLARGVRVRLGAFYGCGFVYTPFLSATTVGEVCQSARIAVLFLSGSVDEGVSRYVWMFTKIGVTKKSDLRLSCSCSTKVSAVFASHG